MTRWCEVTPDGAHQRYDQHAEAGDDVSAVEAAHDVEGRAVSAGAGVHALIHEAEPLQRLAGHEDAAEDDGHGHADEEELAVAALGANDAHVANHATDDQDGGQDAALD